MLQIQVCTCSNAILVKRKTETIQFYYTAHCQVLVADYFKHNIDKTDYYKQSDMDKTDYNKHGNIDNTDYNK